MEGALRLLALARDLVGRRAIEPIGKSPVLGADCPARRVHFVITETGHNGFIGGYRLFLQDLSQREFCFYTYKLT
jgi:hypothetical protein